MLRRLRSLLTYANVMATLGVFIALGGTAYAVNTVGSSDIVDGQVKSVDVGDGEIGSADVKDNSINTFDVHSFLGVDVADGTLTGADIQNESIGVADIGSQQVGPDEVINDSLLQSDIRAGAVTSDEVLDNSLISADVNDNALTGADINESTLNLPQVSTAATFAGVPSPVGISDTLTKVTSKNLPAGSYAVMATMNHSSAFPFGGDQNGDTTCELRNGTGFIGGAQDRRTIPDGDHAEMSLSMNGGAQVPAGGGEVSAWCSSQVPRQIDSGQMMIIRLDGFF